jgi:hypothetical protein
MRNRGAYFHSLQEKFQACEGVEEVDVNPVTGSVLVVTANGAGSVLDYSRKHHLLRIDERVQEMHDAPWTEQMFVSLEHLDHNLKVSTQDRWDLSVAVASGLLGMAAIQVLRGQLMPTAWALLGDAFVILSRSRERRRHERNVRPLMRHEP